MANTAENLIRATRRAAQSHGPDLGQLRKRMDRTVRSARKSANRGIRVTDGYVHKHPWVAVGVAAGAVAVVSLAMVALTQRPRPARAALRDGVEEMIRSAAARLQAIRR